MSRALIMVLLVGCTNSNSATPSCMEAIGHYYTSGCSYSDNTGTEILQGKMVENCQETAAATPAQCDTELDAWLVCTNDVPSAATAAQCDCSQSQMALAGCH